MIYAADFETTTDLEDCRVWAWALSEVGNSDHIEIGNSIEGMIEYCKKEKNVHLFFHNLKFDGEFILNWLFRNGYAHKKDKEELDNKTFTTLISDKGQFYSIEIYFEYDKKGKKTNKLKIWDSLKLLNFSVDQVAKSFNLPISKLTLDYRKKREIGHIITPEEKEYITADVKIMAMALEIMFEADMKKMTIGSNALSQYQQIIGKKKFKKVFPPPAYDADIRQSYKGGFTYLNPKYADQDVGEGIVLDVNSLYPSVMAYCELPYGEGVFYEGKYENDDIYPLYIQMISCSFELRKDHIPMLQIKNNLSFQETEYLKSSNGEEIVLCLTCVDLKLFLEQYEVDNLFYYSGWKFKSTTKAFIDYVEKWNQEKVQATIEKNQGKRTIAKLMLNSLYGKFATNPKVQSKIPFLGEDGVVHYELGEVEEREPLYIPVGAFITAWARNKTIRSAQSVYDRFIYADTDSLHLVGTEIPEGLEISPTKLGAWKHESTFTRARFLRAKSYIEEIDGELKITCAGMPKSCYPFVSWENFHPGAEYSGKLGVKHTQGGIVLVDTPFTIKK